MGTFKNDLKAFLVSDLPSLVTDSSLGALEAYAGQEKRIHPKPFSCQVVYNSGLPTRRDTGIQTHSVTLVLSLDGYSEDDDLFSELEDAVSEITDEYDGGISRFNAGLSPHLVDRVRAIRGPELLSDKRYGRRLSVLLTIDEMKPSE